VGSVIGGDGIVYRRLVLKNGRAEALQLLLPGAHRQDFLRKVHTGMTGGHLGVKRTVDQVQLRAFWPGWRGDVKRFCRQCQSCNDYFRGRFPRSGPWHAHPSRNYILMSQDRTLAPVEVRASHV